jgi:plasmid replication initiation protein
MIQNEWEESLVNLKDVLLSRENDSFSEYRVFNDKVLKVAHKEITTKTACWYSYAPGKKIGNRIVSIRFVLGDLEEAKACGKAPAVLSGMIGNNIVTQVAEEAKIISEFSDSKGFLEESDKGFAIPDYMDPIKGFEDLTKNNNALEVEGLLKMLPLKKLGWADEELSREENYRKYLTVKAREIEGRGANVRKKTRYLIRVIKNEIKDLGLKENKEVSKTSAEKYLSRYSQREYSKEEMDEIERRMLEKSLGLSIPQEGNKDLKE